MRNLKSCWRQTKTNNGSQFELRHFDDVALVFEVESITSSHVRITELRDAPLPLDLRPVNDEGLRTWLKRRCIPKHRAYADTLLSRCGLSLNRPLNIIEASLGLSLNDCFWVVPEGFTASFNDYNLYDSRLSRRLAITALTGLGSVKKALSPEFTTNGALPKCWLRAHGRIKLFKDGASIEPYMEFYASQVAEAMGLNAVKYTLSKLEGRVCSVCDLFTSKEVSFIPAGRLCGAESMSDVQKYYASLGQEYTDALNDMLVFDAVVCNADRHTGNFGLLVDSRTNQIIAPAPIFDNGMSLQGGQKLPWGYDDFIETARSVLANRHLNGLHKLLTFRFKQHCQYNLPDDHLRQLEDFVHERVEKILA